MRQEISNIDNNKEFKTTIACGVICEDENNKVLMVREKKDGKIVWNQPVGHIEPNENLISAAIRETYEETGLMVEITGLVGTYLWCFKESHTVLRYCFSARYSSGTLEPILKEEIMEAKWLSKSELLELKPYFRTPITEACLNDYFSGNIYPLDLIKTI